MAGIVHSDSSQHGQAQNKNGVPDVFRVTNHPLPRFASLASGKVYMRSGPSKRYPVRWVYKKAGLPVEITLEYGAWRKVRDWEGESGWIHTTLLSGRRTGIIEDDIRVTAHAGPDKNSAPVVQFDPGVVLDVQACLDSFCRVSAAGYNGWLARKHIWGIYDHENFD